MMKRISHITICLMPLFWVGCSSVSSKGSYRRGFEEGKASEVKRAYWEEKRAEQETPEIPPEHRYYEIPVPAHTTADGVIIESHSRHVEIVE